MKSDSLLSRPETKRRRAAGKLIVEQPSIIHYNESLQQPSISLKLSQRLENEEYNVFKFVKFAMESRIAPLNRLSLS